MSFNFNFNGKSNNYNTNKSSFRTLVHQKQQFFKRLQRRYNQSNNPSERSFLKTEATRVVNELKAFGNQWKKNGFGSNSWVTRGYSTVSFGNTYKNNTKKTTTRTTRRTTRRTSNKYRSYVAW